MPISGPGDISGLVLDIDPHEESYQDTGGTTPAGAGDSVARVDDQSATGANVTQATGANQPTLQADANGWLYLDFDGTNDQLSNASFQPTASGVQPFSVVVVYQADAEGAIVVGTGGGQQILNHRVNDWQVNLGANFRTNGGAINTLYIAQVVINGASSALDVNGGTITGTGNAGTNAWSAGLFLSGGSDGLLTLNGRIYRVLSYNKVLSSTEITDLYDYLNNLYSNAPPSGDTDPPTLSGWATNTDGDEITATLSEAGCTPASGTGGFTLSGTSATVSGWAISGTTLTLTLSGHVKSGQTVTVSYDDATASEAIADAADNLLADITDAAVTNNSTAESPAITSALTAEGFVGTAFSYQITATGDPASFTYGASNLPAGLSVNTSTGEISGTPTEGVYTADTPVVITADNGVDPPDSANLVITIWELAETTAADAETVQRTGLEASTTYKSFVVAFNAAGESDRSNVEEETTAAGGAESPLPGAMNTYRLMRAG